MTKKQIKFLLDDIQAAHLKALVDVSGLTQQAYLEKVALGGVTSNDTVKDQTIFSQQQTIQSLTEQLQILTKVLGTSQKASTVSITTYLGTKCQVGGCVRGVEAQEVLLKADDKYDDLVLFEGLIWTKSKNANGSQVTLKAVEEVPSDLLKHHMSLSEHQRVSLSRLYKAIDPYRKFTALEGYDQLAPRKQRDCLIDCYCSSDDPEYIEEKLSSAQALIAEIFSHTPERILGTKTASNISPVRLLEGTLEVIMVPSNTTATIEPDTNDSVQDEVIPVATLEPSAQVNQKLTTEELVERFKPQLANKGMINTIRTNLGYVRLQKLKEGWTSQHDPESLTWLPTDETREYWVAVEPHTP